MNTATETKQEMYNRIHKHGEQLKSVFNIHQSKDPVKLCKALRRYENKANKIALDICNGDIEQNYDTETKLTCILDNVNQLLCNVQKEHIPVFINLDPRGYALKIKSEYVSDKSLNIYRDMGGYGIIAPDLK